MYSAENGRYPFEPNFPLSFAKGINSVSLVPQVIRLVEQVGKVPLLPCYNNDTVPVDWNSTSKNVSKVENRRFT